MKSDKPPPEGAEVKLIAEDLAKKVGLRELVSVTAMSGRYTKKPVPGLDDLEKSLPTRVVGIGAKGKLIFWILADDRFLLNTLGMTGFWSMEDQKHARMKFEFSEGDPVYYVDQRNFGTFRSIYGRNVFKKKLDSLGPDMLSDRVTPELFAERLDSKPHWTIAQALMDQSVVSGCGNYVKSETLHAARVSPHRLVGSLSSKEVSDINDAAQWVLNTSYENGGASIRDYRTPDNKPSSMAENFQVYGKKVDPLGNKVIKEETADKRTTHWVPGIQK